MAIRRDRIRKYFKPFPGWTRWWVFLGVVAVAIGASTEEQDAAAFIGIGLVMVAIGVAAMVAAAGRPSDRQMDRWIEEDLNRVAETALTRLGLDESQLLNPEDPVIVTGPRFWDTAGADIGVRLGKDGEIRFTPMGVTVINFGHDQLVAYQCALDLMTGNPLSESTDEYFYQDVVAVSTQSDSVSFDEAMLTRQARRFLKGMIENGKLQLKAAETFVLTTSGGTSLRVVLDDPQLAEMAGGGRIPKTRAEKAIGKVRTMLRAKKGGGHSTGP